MSVTIATFDEAQLESSVELASSEPHARQRPTQGTKTARRSDETRDETTDETRTDNAIANTRITGPPVTARCQELRCVILGATKAKTRVLRR
jgi:hypothetical protein